VSSTVLAKLLNLASHPVAITFVDAAPPGVPHVTTTEPAGCGFWRRAAAGEVFYTVADDHKHCLLGAYTHNVALSPAEKSELMDLLGTMVNVKYLKMEEVPELPIRQTPLQVAVYAPLDAAPMPPDVVLVCGNPRQLMLLSEAAQAAGVAGAGPILGRPTCALVPQAIESGCTAASFGCIGNRIYTGATDNDAYLAIPGWHLRAVEENLAVIVRANEELEKFHRVRALAV
jgi:uncharacterized protein (DUF169 family)